jgi:hypothetical protein
LVTIPESVRRLLWDYDDSACVGSAEVHDVVIERVMARGGWAEMLWLLSVVEVDRLRGFLERRGARVLAPRELRFWSFACGVPDDAASAWVGEARVRMARWRG